MRELAGMPFDDCLACDEGGGGNRLFNFCVVAGIDDDTEGGGGGGGIFNFFRAGSLLLSWPLGTSLFFDAVSVAEDGGGGGGGGDGNECRFEDLFGGILDNPNVS